MIAKRQPARLRLRRKLAPLADRYSLRRALTLSITFGILYAVPLSGLIRFDAYDGNHSVLFEPTSAVRALSAVVVGFLVLVIATFAFNVVGGRLFCGWGCPAAQISRFCEDVESAQTRGTQRVRSILNGGLFGAALSVSLMLWWTSPRVFVGGDLVPTTIAMATLLLLVGLSFVHGRIWRWDFCRKTCPIGLYYSVVSPSTSYGIVFERDAATCIDCNACTAICPVDLQPRELELPLHDIGGLALGGLPSDNHCIRCGDCVTICEFILRDRPRQEVPIHFGIGVKGRPLRPRKENYEPTR